MGHPRETWIGMNRKRLRGFVLWAFLGLTLLVPEGIRAAGFFGANNNHFQNLGAPAPDALPVLKGSVESQLGISGIVSSKNKLEIQQDEEKAVIEWESFDIGENAWTHFNQQGEADWVALNRIFDQSPSQIFGRLTADGKIYLINQNGILFGPSAKVNVHSLIASSLNIDDELIGGGTLRFRAEDYQNDPGDPDFLPGPVCNWAVSASDPEVGIHAAQAGSILLIAPEVTNRGYITAPSGQIALAAGRGVEVKALEDRTLPHVLVTDTGDLGVSVNSSSGLLVADAGVAGMYGRIVRQEGLIRSVTAVEAGGSVELLASEGVLLGPDSLTSAPITSNTERFHQSFVGAQGDIRIGGLGKTTENNQGQIVFEPSSTQYILHQGEILAPSGTVDMSASEWVYLDRESRIDVSGEWVQVSADASIIGLQLNTMELKNDYTQQGGILQGQEVQILGYQGSPIGDLSAAVNAQYLSALEMNTKGGEITIHSEADKLKQIIMRPGAVIDIAGGGKLYTEGHYDGTKLLSGMRVYDISEAPAWYRYEKILGTHQAVHERYGLTDLFEGLYLGGASPTSDFLSGHVEGHDAGTLTLEARGVVLNGTVIGSAQAGLYQTDLAIPEEQIGRFFLESTRGTRQPRGGRLVLGIEAAPSGDNPFDLGVDEVVVAAESAPLAEDFEPGDDMRGTNPEETAQTSTFTVNDDPLYRTVLSAETLNQSGLSDIRIYSNTQVTVEEDVLLTLSPGGYLVDDGVAYQSTMPVPYDVRYGYDPATLTIWARAFENRGTIDIPSGNITIELKDTAYANRESTSPIELPARAYFAEESAMSVAGERINNLYAGLLGTLETGFIDGGRISVKDDTQLGADVIVRSGAVLDVSAGYELDPDGDLTAGRAGSLSLEGSTLVLEGDLKGYGLPGQDGGELTLHATRLTVSPDAPEPLPEGFGYDSELPEAMQEHFVLAQDQLAETGFTRITLKSFRDLTFEEGVTFSPSNVKLALPGPGADLLAGFGLTNYSGSAGDGESDLSSRGLVRVSPEYVGASRIAALAGEGVTRTDRDDDRDFVNEGIFPRVLLPEGVVLETPPQGEIALSSVGLLDLKGTLHAPAGAIGLTSRVDSIHLAKESRILAQGVNLPQETALFPGLPVGYTPLDGGTVTLSAPGGAVTMEKGARIDVSGSDAVDTYMLTAGNLPRSMEVAGHAGALEIGYKTDLSLAGEIQGRADLPEAHGGALTLSRHGGAPLLVEEERFERFHEDGFDSFTFRSEGGIQFAGAMNLDVGRYLELDAPLITGLDDLGSGEIALFATHVVLSNTREKYIDEDSNASESNLVEDWDPDVPETWLDPGEASLALTGEWLDIEGHLALQGFQTVSLEASRDIRVVDEEYLNTDDTSKYRWAGQLRTEGDLTLKAARIYPAMKEVTFSDGDRVLRVLTPSAFAFRSDTGTVTILPGEAEPEGPVLSAGGVLAVVAPEIEHQGHLAAPLGQIVLAAAPWVDVQDAGGGLMPARDVSITAKDGHYDVTIDPLDMADVGLNETVPEDVEAFVNALAAAPGRVSLGGGSVTTTHSDVPVPYGLLQGVNWRIPTKHRSLKGTDVRSMNPDGWATVSAPPDMGVLVRGAQVDFGADATIDASGGGGIYASEFLPGVDGLAHPLEVAGRSVILPGASYPGEAVHLAGTGDLPGGDYTLLPVEYAFLPGAYVIEDQGGASSLEGAVLSEEGYTAVLGYRAEAGTEARSPGYRRYTVRPAADVLQEGMFRIAESVAGSAGTVSIVGKTVTLDGTLALTSLPLFEGGVIELGAERIAIGTGGGSARDVLQIDPAFFDGMDLEEIRIGAVSTAEQPLLDTLETDEIAFMEGQLTAPKVTLAADENDVDLQEGAEIHAVDESAAFTVLTYQYTYDPAVGLGVLSPAAIRRVGEGQDVAGTVLRRTAGGEVPLHFYTEDGTFKWVAEQEEPDLEGLGFAGETFAEAEQAALLALIPEEFSHEHALPYGKAVLRSNEGSIILGDGSLIHATDEVELDGQPDFRGGRVRADNSALTLAGKNIYFVSDPDASKSDHGLYLSETLFDALNAFEDLTLRSGRHIDSDGDGIADTLEPGTGDFLFHEEGFDIEPTQDLTIRAGRIAALTAGGEGTTITGEVIYLEGTVSEWTGYAGDAPSHLDVYPAGNLLATPEDQNVITIHATDEMTVRGGHLLMDGFASIHLKSDTAIAFQGEGSLTAGFEEVYAAGDGTPTLTLDAPVVTAPTAGALALEAELIDHQGTLDVPGGQILLGASGKIDLMQGSEILARGGIVVHPLGSSEDQEAYEPTDFHIVAGAYSSDAQSATDRKGRIDIQGGGGSAADTPADSGEAATVDVYQGGSVTLESEGDGGVVRDPGAVIDVSNDDRTAEVEALLGAEQAARLAEAGLMDAGTLSISAAKRTLTETAGDLNLTDANWKNKVLGDSVLGAGGGFSLSTGRLLTAGGGTYDLAGLSENLKGAGFTREVAINAHSQGLLLESGTLRAHHIKLVSGGDLEIGKADGTIGAPVIDASVGAKSPTNEPGMVELYARENLTVYGGTQDFWTIDASRKTGKGGEVHLHAGHIIDGDWSGPDPATGSGTGVLSLGSNALINVEGEGEGDGGTVRLRAYRNGGNANMSFESDGVVQGASEITAETTQAYKLSLSSDLGSFSDYAVSPLDNFTKKPSTIPGTHGTAASFQERPGIEIRSEKDLTLTGDWELPAGNLGVLTLRSGGDLRIQGGLTSTRTVTGDARMRQLSDDDYSGDPSWGINLIAGADTQSADLWATRIDRLEHLTVEQIEGMSREEMEALILAEGDLDDALVTVPGKTDLMEAILDELDGNLYIGTFYVSGAGTIESNNPAIVYTENGPLQFATGRNLFLGPTGATKDNLINIAHQIKDQGSLGFNFATFAGDIRGRVGRDLRLQGNSSATKGTGGVIQSAVGDIDIHVGDDLKMDLNAGSAIRTTGQFSTRIERELSYDMIGHLDGLDLGGLKDIVRNNSTILSFAWPALGFKDIEAYGEEERDLLREHVETALLYIEDEINNRHTDDSVWKQNAAYFTAHDGGSIQLDVGSNVVPLDTFEVALMDDSNTLMFWSTIYDYFPWYSGKAGLVPNDFQYMWAADYVDGGTAGVATMGGGDLFLWAGQDVQAQIGTFKQGDLSVIAGADLGGFYEVADGRGVLSGGRVISHFEEDNLSETSLALIRAEVDVLARGDVQLGTAFNPTFTTTTTDGMSGTDAPQGVLTYSYTGDLDDDTLTTSLRLTSVSGDVSISGQFLNQGGRYTIFPPVLEVEAGGDISIQNSLSLAPAPLGQLLLTAGGDIYGGANRSTIAISDVAPSSINYLTDTFFSSRQDLPEEEETMPGIASDNAIRSLIRSEHTEANAHAAEPIHLDDPNPVNIQAGGALRELVLYSPKATQIRADGDIQGLHLISQNLDAEDVSSVSAGGILNLSSTIERVVVRNPQATSGGASYARSGLLFGGPGTFFVQAGETMRLGMTQGIRTTGNAFNPGLDAVVAAQEGAPSSLIVISGLDKSFEKEEIRGFFEGIKTGGEEYSGLLAAGDAAGAAAAVEGVREEVIQPLFEGAELGQGNIYMTSSQISTEGTSTRSSHETQGGGSGLFDDSSDLYIIARGNVDVGLTTIPEPDTGTGSAENTGLFTAQGGNINLFSVGDLDVNESRMMTFRGGDILVWSDEGNINAGRGSKTAVSAQPPRRKPVYAMNEEGTKILWVNVNGEPEKPKPSDEWPEGSEIEPVVESYTIEFSPPAVGSGVRTVTYDPDGAQGPMEAPALGDAFLFAPSGIIDAGEAGIAARNVVLGATQVVNAQNISFTAGSVGVPTSSGGANLGALSGMGGLSEADKMASQTSSMAADKSAAAQEEAKLAEAFVPKWLDVKVVSFDELEEDEEEKE